MEVTIMGAFHFEAYFESTKHFCQMVPHILTDDQKRVRVQIKPLSIFTKFNQRRFSNIVTGDERFEPVGKIVYKVWITKL
jgi:hypothetical protein